MYSPDDQTVISYLVFTDLNLSDEPMTGMLDTDSPDSGDSPATEGSGEAFMPDLPVLTQAADWSMDNVPTDTLTTILSDDSDQSQESLVEDQPDQQLDPTGLGSVENAVEQFQLANAQLFEEELPPPPPPPLEQEDAEQTQEPSEEDSTESLKRIQQMSLELTTVSEPTGQDGAQGNKMKNILSIVSIHPIILRFICE